MITTAQTRASGVLFALSAGILWGFVPVYIHFLGDVDPLEIVAHRSLWSLVLLSGQKAAQVTTKTDAQQFPGDQHHQGNGYKQAQIPIKYRHLMQIRRHLRGSAPL